MTCDRISSVGWTFSSAVLTFTLLCVPPALAQRPHRSDPSNLLANPGFETGDFTGWTVSGNSPNYGVNVAGFQIAGTDYATTVLVHSGTFAGYAVVCGLFCDVYLDLSQRVNVVPGATYWAGFWLGDGSNQPFGNSVTISVDGAPILLTWDVQVEPGYHFVGGVFAATDAQPVIDFHIEGSGGALAGFSFDDFCISGNPLTCQSPYAFQSIVFLGDTFTEALGINNAELIAGYHGYGGTGHPNQGFLLTLPNNFTTENYPGAVQTQVIAVNTAGNIAGSYLDQGGVTHGFLNIGGVYTTVDFPGTTFNQLLGLNDADEAVGYYYSSGNKIPYTYLDGTFATIDSQLPPHYSAQPNGINNSGDLSGTYYDQVGLGIHGFVVHAGTATTLDFPGAYYTYGTGLNNEGQVVGYYDDVIIQIHGFVYDVSSQQFKNFDNPIVPYGNLSINDINDSGQIVGYYNDAAGNIDGFVGSPQNPARR
jgi:hypothetical protein